MGNNIKLLTIGDCVFEDEFLSSDNYSKLKEIIKEYDIVSVNLETTVSNLEGEKSQKAYNFKIKQDNIKLIDDDIKKKLVFNLANNHTMDYGEVCLIDMVNFLDSSNISHIGVEYCKKRVTYKNINGAIIAFIGAYEGKTKRSNYEIITVDDRLIKDVEVAKNNSDYVIVNLHWGEELSLCPSPNQVKFAHNIIDAGVDLIIGHHPHVIQGIEVYKGKNIVYSLGNFQIVTAKQITEQNYGYMLGFEIIDKKIQLTNKYRIFIKDCMPMLLGRDNKYMKEFLKLERKSELYLLNNSWGNFYKESSYSFLKSSKDAWRKRFKNKEKYVKMKFLRWLIRKKTIKMIYYYGKNRIRNI